MTGHMKYVNDKPIVRVWSELWFVHRAQIRNRRQIYGFYTPYIIGYKDHALPFRKLLSVSINGVHFYETYVQSAEVQRFMKDFKLLYYSKKRHWSDFNSDMFNVSLEWIGQEMRIMEYQTEVDVL